MPTMDDYYEEQKKRVAWLKSRGHRECPTCLGVGEVAGPGCKCSECFGAGVLFVEAPFVRRTISG